MPAIRNIEDTIFETGLPVNTRAMLHRMEELLKSCGTNCLGDRRGMGDSRFRKLLWLINSQYFGCTATIDMNKEWTAMWHLENDGKED